MIEPPSCTPFLLCWLNANAGAVQAVAAAVTAVLTVLLFYATRRYVHLTADLAKTAAEQITLQRDAAALSERLSRVHLRQISAKVVECVRDLTPQDPPADAPDGASGAWAPSLSYQEEFESAAAHVGQAHLEDAIRIREHFAWFSAHAGRTSYGELAQPSDLGVRAEWVERHRDASARLARLLG